MSITTHNIELLDYLAAKTGCIYLSDLHTPVYQYIVSTVIRHIDVDAFSLDAWNEAVLYITGETKIFDDKITAAAYLKNYRF